MGPKLFCLLSVLFIFISHFYSSSFHIFLCFGVILSLFLNHLAGSWAPLALPAKPWLLAWVLILQISPTPPVGGLWKKRLLLQVNQINMGLKKQNDSHTKWKLTVIIRPMHSLHVKCDENTPPPPHHNCTASGSHRQHMMAVTPDILGLPLLRGKLSLRSLSFLFDSY